MRQSPPVALVVDSERSAASLITALRRAGFETMAARDDEAAAEALDETPVDCVVTRLRSKRIDGLRVLERARARNPHSCVVVLTDAIDADVAAQVIARGADDLQTGPLHVERVLAVFRRGLERGRLAARVAELERTLDRRYREDPLTGTSPAIQRVVDQIRHVAPTRAMVLIEGERGTGKSRVARAIHQGSPRREGPFVRVSLGAIGESRIEEEIFGGAGGEGSPGWLERADQGTLLLDEIDRAPASTQVRLLGAIRGRGGGEAAIPSGRKSDVRILAATDQDLDAHARAGRFRADLLERLGAVRIVLPPLRDRRLDIPLLVDRFLREANRAHARRVSGITRGALERLASYAWPGNVEELRDRIEGMVVAAHGRRRLDLSDLPAALRGEKSRSEGVALTAGMTVEEAERQLIEATLRHTGGDKPRAAAMLGIGLRTLYRKIRQYRLT